MFKNPSSNWSTDFTSFQAAGLKDVDQVVFSKKNLIIGKNGSGKTRFLKALEQEKKGKDKKEIVITLYFPEIQAFYNSDLSKLQEEITKDSTQEIYPYDLLLDNEDNSFYDFLKIMESDRGGFLENILAVLSMKKTQKTIKAMKTFEELNKILSEFLEKRIHMEQSENKIYIEKTDDTEVRRLPLTEALSEFSPGELMLFYLCVFLMTIKRKSSNSVVLIIDEPELHLHPRALIKMVKTLMDFESVSELWIASHSLFLVPLFSFDEIVYMDQGNALRRNSQTYKKLYDSLVGLENVDVFEFLKSLDNWQYYQFIIECFCLPEPVDKVDINDEQFRKLLSSIRDNLKFGPIQMLDYGAGKCRIWECMQLLPDSEIEKNNVVYTAYEPYPEDVEGISVKLYTKFEDIYKDKRHFHVVVLMNVLHEIELEQWEQTFQNINNILSEDGVLIFLEVLSLTKGEQPYGNNGYLVLQDEQVKILFGDNNIVNMRKEPQEKSNCWMITKKQIGNVTSQTIEASIISLRDTSLNVLRSEFQKRIKYAHQKNDSFEKQIAARKYAFLSQQYINAFLSLGLYIGKSTSRAHKVKPATTEVNVQSIGVTGIKKPYDK